MHSHSPHQSTNVSSWSLIFVLTAIVTTLHVLPIPYYHIVADAVSTATMSSSTPFGGAMRSLPKDILYAPEFNTLGGYDYSVDGSSTIPTKFPSRTDNTNITMVNDLSSSPIVAVYITRGFVEYTFEVSEGGYYFLNIDLCTKQNSYGQPQVTLSSQLNAQYPADSRTFTFESYDEETGQFKPSDSSTSVTFNPNDYGAYVSTCNRGPYYSTKAPTPNLQQIVHFYFSDQDGFSGGVFTLRVENVDSVTTTPISFGYITLQPFQLVSQALDNDTVVTTSPTSSSTTSNPMSQQLPSTTSYNPQLDNGPVRGITTILSGPLLYSGNSPTTTGNYYYNPALLSTNGITPEKEEYASKMLVLGSSSSSSSSSENYTRGIPIQLANYPGSNPWDQQLSAYRTLPTPSSTACADIQSTPSIAAMVYCSNYYSPTGLQTGLHAPPVFPFTAMNTSSTNNNDNNTNNVTLAVKIAPMEELPILIQNTAGAGLFTFSVDVKYDSSRQLQLTLLQRKSQDREANKITLAYYSQNSKTSSSNVGSWEYMTVSFQGASIYLRNGSNVFSLRFTYGSSSSYTDPIYSISVSYLYVKRVPFVCPSALPAPPTAWDWLLWPNNNYTTTTTPNNNCGGDKMRYVTLAEASSLRYMNLPVYLNGSAFLLPNPSSTAPYNSTAMWSSASSSFSASGAGFEAGSSSSTYLITRSDSALKFQSSTTARSPNGKVCLRNGDWVRYGYFNFPEVGNYVLSLAACGYSTNFQLMVGAPEIATAEGSTFNASTTSSSILKRITLPGTVYCPTSNVPSFTTDTAVTIPITTAGNYSIRLEASFTSGSSSAYACIDAIAIDNTPSISKQNVETIMSKHFDWNVSDVDGASVINITRIYTNTTTNTSMNVTVMIINVTTLGNTYNNFSAIHFNGGGVSRDGMAIPPPFGSITNPIGNLSTTSSSSSSSLSYNFRSQPVVSLSPLRFTNTASNWLFNTSIMGNTTTTLEMLADGVIEQYVADNMNSMMSKMMPSVLYTYAADNHTSLLSEYLQAVRLDTGSKISYSLGNITSSGFYNSTIRVFRDTTSQFSSCYIDVQAGDAPPSSITVTVPSSSTAAENPIYPFTEMSLLPTPIPILNTADFPAGGGATTISLSSRCSYGSVYVSRLAFTPTASMSTTASDVARSVTTGMQFTEIDAVAGTTMNSGGGSVGAANFSLTESVMPPPPYMGNASSTYRPLVSASIYSIPQPIIGLNWKSPFPLSSLVLGNLEVGSVYSYRFKMMTAATFRVHMLLWTSYTATTSNYMKMKISFFKVLDTSPSTSSSADGENEETITKLSLYPITVLEPSIYARDIKNNMGGYPGIPWGRTLQEAYFEEGKYVVRVEVTYAFSTSAIQQSTYFGGLSFEPSQLSPLISLLPLSSPPAGDNMTLPVPTITDPFVAISSSSSSTTTTPLLVNADGTIGTIEMEDYQNLLLNLPPWTSPQSTPTTVNGSEYRSDVDSAKRVGIYTSIMADPTTNTITSPSSSTTTLAPSRRFVRLPRSGYNLTYTLRLPISMSEQPPNGNLIKLTISYYLPSVQSDSTSGTYGTSTNLAAQIGLSQRQYDLYTPTSYSVSLALKSNRPTDSTYYQYPGRNDWQLSTTTINLYSQFDLPSARSQAGSTGVGGGGSAVVEDPTYFYLDVTILGDSTMELYLDYMSLSPLPSSSSSTPSAFPYAMRPTILSSSSSSSSSSWEDGVPLVSWRYDIQGASVGDVKLAYTNNGSVQYIRKASEVPLVSISDNKDLYFYEEMSEEAAGSGCNGSSSTGRVYNASLPSNAFLPSPTIPLATATNTSSTTPPSYTSSTNASCPNIRTSVAIRTPNVAYLSYTVDFQITGMYDIFFLGATYKPRAQFKLTFERLDDSGAAMETIAGVGVFVINNNGVTNDALTEIKTRVMPNTTTTSTYNGSMPNARYSIVSGRILDTVSIPTAGIYVITVVPYTPDYLDAWKGFRFMPVVASSSSTTTSTSSRPFYGYNYSALVNEIGVRNPDTMPSTSSIANGDNKILIEGIHFDNGGYGVGYYSTQINVGMDSNRIRSGCIMQEDSSSWTVPGTNHPALSLRYLGFIKYSFVSPKTNRGVLSFYWGSTSSSTVYVDIRVERRDFNTGAILETILAKEQLLCPKSSDGLKTTEIQDTLLFKKGGLYTVTLGNISYASNSIKLLSVSVDLTVVDIPPSQCFVQSPLTTMSPSSCTNALSVASRVEVGCTMSSPLSIPFNDFVGGGSSYAPACDAPSPGTPQIFTAPTSPSTQSPFKGAAVQFSVETADPNTLISTPQQRTRKEYAIGDIITMSEQAVAVVEAGGVAVYQRTLSSQGNKFRVPTPSDNIAPSTKGMVLVGMTTVSSTCKKPLLKVVFDPEERYYQFYGISDNYLTSYGNPTSCKLFSFGSSSSSYYFDRLFLQGCTLYATRQDPEVSNLPYISSTYYGKVGGSCTVFSGSDYNKIEVEYESGALFRLGHFDVRSASLVLKGVSAAYQSMNSMSPQTAVSNCQDGNPSSGALIAMFSFPDSKSLVFTDSTTNSSTTSAVDHIKLLRFLNYDTMKRIRVSGISWVRGDLPEGTCNVPPVVLNSVTNNMAVSTYFEVGLTTYTGYPPVVDEYDCARACEANPSCQAYYFLFLQGYNPQCGLTNTISDIQRPRALQGVYQYRIFTGVIRASTFSSTLGATIPTQYTSRRLAASSNTQASTTPLSRLKDFPESDGWVAFIIPFSSDSYITDPGVVGITAGMSLINVERIVPTVPRWAFTHRDDYMMINGRNVQLQCGGSFRPFDNNASGVIGEVPVLTHIEALADFCTAPPANTMLSCGDTRLSDPGSFPTTTPSNWYITLSPHLPVTPCPGDGIDRLELAAVFAKAQAAPPTAPTTQFFVTSTDKVLASTFLTVESYATTVDDQAWYVATVPTTPSKPTIPWSTNPTVAAALMRQGCTFYGVGGEMYARHVSMKTVTESCPTTTLSVAAIFKQCRSSTSCMGVTTYIRASDGMEVGGCLQLSSTTIPTSSLPAGVSTVVLYLAKQLSSAPCTLQNPLDAGSVKIQISATPFDVNAPGSSPDSFVTIMVGDSVVLTRCGGRYGFLDVGSRGSYASSDTGLCYDGPLTLPANSTINIYLNSTGRFLVANAIAVVTYGLPAPTFRPKFPLGDEQPTTSTTTPSLTTSPLYLPSATTTQSAIITVVNMSTYGVVFHDQGDSLTTTTTTTPANAASPRFLLSDTTSLSSDVVASEVSSLPVSATPNRNTQCTPATGAATTTTNSTSCTGQILLCQGLTASNTNGAPTITIPTNPYFPLRLQQSSSQVQYTRLQISYQATTWITTPSQRCNTISTTSPVSGAIVHDGIPVIQITDNNVLHPMYLSDVSSWFGVGDLSSGSGSNTTTTTTTTSTTMDPTGKALTTIARTSIDMSATTTHTSDGHLQLPPDTTSHLLTLPKVFHFGRYFQNTIIGSVIPPRLVAFRTIDKGTTTTPPGTSRSTILPPPTATNPPSQGIASLPLQACILEAFLTSGSYVCSVNLTYSNFLSVYVAQTSFGDVAMTVSIEMGGSTTTCGGGRSFSGSPGSSGKCDQYLACLHADVPSGTTSAIITFTSPQVQTSSCSVAAMAVAMPKLITSVPTCTSDGFLCKVDNKCIPRTLMCDGVADCSDGVDEAYCQSWRLVSKAFAPRCLQVASMATSPNSDVIVYDDCKAFAILTALQQAATTTSSTTTTTTPISSVSFLHDSATSLCAAFTCVSPTNADTELIAVTDSNYSPSETLRYYARIERPSTYMKCTSELFCNGRGSVQSDSPPCTCQCLNGYSGAGCEVQLDMTAVTTLALGFPSALSPSLQSSIQSILLGIFRQYGLALSGVALSPLTFGGVPGLSGGSYSSTVLRHFAEQAAVSNDNTYYYVASAEGASSASLEGIAVSSMLTSVGINDIETALLGSGASLQDIGTQTLLAETHTISCNFTYSNAATITCGDTIPLPANAFLYSYSALFFGELVGWTPSVTTTGTPCTIETTFTSGLNCTQQKRCYNTQVGISSSAVGTAGIVLLPTVTSTSSGTGTTKPPLGICTAALSNNELLVEVTITYVPLLPAPDAAENSKVGEVEIPSDTVAQATKYLKFIWIIPALFGIVAFTSFKKKKYEMGVFCGTIVILSIMGMIVLAAVVIDGNPTKTTHYGVSQEFRSPRCSNSTISPIPHRVARVPSSSTCQQAESLGTSEGATYMSIDCGQASGSYPGYAMVRAGASLPDCEASIPIKIFPNQCVTEASYFRNRTASLSEFAQVACYSTEAADALFALIDSDYRPKIALTEEAIVSEVPVTDRYRIITDSSDEGKGGSDVFFRGATRYQQSHVQVIDTVDTPSEDVSGDSSDILRKQRTIFGTIEVSNGTNPPLNTLTDTSPVYFEGTDTPSDVSRKSSTLSNKSFAFNAFTLQAAAYGEDSLRYLGVADSTKLDMSFDREMTITFWMKASSDTTGFVFAMVDNWVTKGSYQSPIIEKVREILENGLGSQYYFDSTWNMYAGVYVNGPSRTVSLMYAAPGSGVQELSWNLRAEKVQGQDVFDGAWHYVALAIGKGSGSSYAQLFIDGRTSYVDEGWRQCFDNSPPRVSRIPDRVFIESVAEEEVVNDAVLYVGHLKGSVWNVQAHNSFLPQEKVIAYGSPLMQRYNRIDIDKSEMLGKILGATAIIGLVVSLLQLIRAIVIRRRRDNALEEEAEEVSGGEQQSEAMEMAGEAQGNLEEAGGAINEQTGIAGKITERAKNAKSGMMASGKGGGNNAIATNASKAKSSATQYMKASKVVVSRLAKQVTSIRMIIPSVLTVAQTMAIYFQGWNWPDRFKINASLVIWWASFDVNMAFPNVPPMVTPAIQVCVAVIACSCVIVILLRDNASFLERIERGGGLPTASEHVPLTTEIAVKFDKGRRLTVGPAGRTAFYRAIGEAAALSGSHVRAHIIFQEAIGPEGGVPVDIIATTKKLSLSLKVILLDPMDYSSIGLSVQEAASGRVKVLVKATAQCPKHNEHLINAVETIHDCVVDSEGESKYTCAYRSNEGRLFRRVTDGGDNLCTGLAPTFFVCPNDSCSYSICGACYQGGFGDKLKANLHSKRYWLRRKGLYSILGMVLLLLAQAIHMPLVKNALMIVWCHVDYQCQFPNCYTNPTSTFIVYVAFASILLIFFGVGLIVYFFFVSLRRKALIRGIMRSAITMDKVLLFSGMTSTDWDVLQGKDDSLLKPLYEPYTYRWMWVHAFTMVFKIATVAPIVFASPNSLTQLALASTAEAVQLAFWVLINPFSDHWVGFLTCTASIHQVAQLSLISFNRAVVSVDPEDETFADYMIMVSILYLTILIIVVIGIVIVPFVRGLLAKRREKQAAEDEHLRTIELEASQTRSTTTTTTASSPRQQPLLGKEDDLSSSDDDIILDYSPQHSRHHHHGSGGGSDGDDDMEMQPRAAASVNDASHLEGLSTQRSVSSELEL